MTDSLRLLWRSTNRRVVFMLSLLLAIWFVFDVLSGGYILRAENIANLFRQVTVVAVLGTGMTLVIASGNIDLSVGSALGMFGAFLAAMITQVGMNPLLAVLLALATGVGMGVLHGAIIHYLRVPSFVVTLGGLIAYRGVTQYVARQSIPIRIGWVKGIAQDYLPGWLSVAIMIVVIVSLSCLLFRRREVHAAAEIPLVPLWVDLTKLTATSLLVIALTLVMIAGAGFPVQAMLFLGVALLVGLAAQYTRFGRYVYAIGGNRAAAHYSGISLARNTMGVFAVMGLLSALAGIITVSELSSAAPDIGDLKELEAIAACVIGGTSLMGGSGSIGMSIFGALIMTSIKNGMSMMGIAAQLQKVILGSLLVIAVALDQWSRRDKRV